MAGIGTLSDHGRLKHCLISALGESRLSRAAYDRGFRQNRHLLGVYGFGGSADDYSVRLSAWCLLAEDHGLLMCHPAAGEDRHDIIAAARWNEFTVLRSERFAELLAAQATVVTRLSTSLSDAPPGRGAT